MSRYATSSLPFKGKGTLEAEQRVRVGMGAAPQPHPLPSLLLRFKCALAPYGQVVSLVPS